MLFSVNDLTLPRTRDVTCDAREHDEAVFFSASTEDGMPLFFDCTKCGNRWHDRTESLHAVQGTFPQSIMVHLAVCNSSILYALRFLGS